MQARRTIEETNENDDPNPISTGQARNSTAARVRGPTSRNPRRSETLSRFHMLDSLLPYLNMAHAERAKPQEPLSAAVPTLQNSCDCGQTSANPSRASSDEAQDGRVLQPGPTSFQQRSAAHTTRGARRVRTQDGWHQRCYRFARDSQRQADCVSCSTNTCRSRLTVIR